MVDNVPFALAVTAQTTNLVFGALTNTFVTVLNLPIARVALTDKTGLEPPRVVDNVPFALAVTAQTTNLVFGAL
ncbi:hypothetical protein, partial [Escherichia coli]|uniref:hypothetical protein n=1 Tax=Escherichia coli TaxID=562 RepID=UPI001BC8795D